MAATAIEPAVLDTPAENNTDDSPAAAATDIVPASGEDADVDPDMPRTIFVDPENFDIKHPLQSAWTLWYDNPGRKTTQKNWHASLKAIYTFSFVEDFWALYNAVKPASELGQGANYHLFLDGVEPKWEDPGNVGGGKWVVTITKANRASFDKLWLYTMLGLIGESFPSSENVVGCVCSVRKSNDRVAVWTRNANDQDIQVGIGRHLKAMLELPDKELLGYQAHNDCIKRNRSFNNRNKYEV